MTAEPERRPGISYGTDLRVHFTSATVVPSPAPACGAGDEPGVVTTMVTALAAAVTCATCLASAAVAEAAA